MHHLSCARRAPLSKQKTKTTFLTLQTRSQGHCLGALCLLPLYGNDPGGKSTTLPQFYSAGFFNKRLWLAVDKVIHHNDIVLPIIIRPRGNVAGCDSHLRDARIVKHDTEEGKTPIAWGGRNKAAE